MTNSFPKQNKIWRFCILCSDQIPSTWLSNSVGTYQLIFVWKRSGIPFHYQLPSPSQTNLKPALYRIYLVLDAQFTFPCSSRFFSIRYACLVIRSSLMCNIWNTILKNSYITGYIQRVTSCCSMSHDIRCLFKYFQ